MASEMGTEEAGVVEVRVRTLDGQTSRVGIRGNQTVKDLKRLLMKESSFNLTFQHCHLFLRGSKLDTGAQIDSLFLQEDEFIVLIPFANKRLNDLSISVTQQSIPQTHGSLLGETSQTSGSHTQAVADAAWHDIISDLTMLSNLSKPSQDVQYSTVTESMLGKNYELHGNKESYDREHMDSSLNSSSSFDEAGNNIQRKNLENKRTGLNSINCQESAVKGVLTRNAESACVEILGEKKCDPGRHSISSKECSLADTRVDYSSRLLKLVRETDRELNTLCDISKKNPETEDEGRKRRKVFSYPPALQRPIKIFRVLNTVYGFLQKQHMQATWGNVRGALKQLCCHAFEEVSVKEIEKLAALCPKVVVLNGRAGDGEELTFSIDLLDSSRLQMHEQLHVSHDAIPGGNQISDRATITAITRRQNAFEVHLLEVVKYWQESQTSSRKTLDSVTLEELVLSAKDMCQTTSKSGMEECATRTFPRMHGGHNTQYRCSETNELTPFDMVEHLRKGLGSSGQLVHVETINPRKAKYGDNLITFSESTKAALRRMGISMLYSHQAEAIQASLSRKDVVVATSTASGKSLCYNIPVLEELSTDRLACALYLFPTKALAQDQLRALLGMTGGLEFTLNMGVYDGDTSQSHRIWLRENARLLITNPDMLHVSILPSHKQFERIFSNLRFVIIDEAHAYKGAFGCHTALILRRMRRICHHLYGTNPTFITSSATFANPREHAMELANLREVEVVLEDGSPCGSKLFLLWNPSVCLDHQQSALQKPKRRKYVKIQDSVTLDTHLKRASPIVEASRIFAELVQHGLRSIAFCNTRKLSELVLSYTRQILKETAPHLVNLICVYRAGYTTQERRKIESGLFGGNLLGVAATNALELGIDVGNLDATLHLGFPGSVASLWQQAGRAGRREKASLSVYVAFEGPLDQHFMKHPPKLFSRPIEHSQVDAYNTQVVKQHIACAALEYPIDLQHDVEFFGSALHDATMDLMKKGYLGRNPNGGPEDESWHYIGKEKHPSFMVSIRAIDPEKYTVINQAINEVIEEIEESKAFFEVYEGAVYMHQGKTYLVKTLDLSAKIALCQEADLKYYTKTRDFTDIHVTGGELAYPGKLSGFNYPTTTAQANLCKVTTKWIGFRRIWRGSNQVFDSVDLFLPEYSYESQAVWIRVPPQIKTETAQQNLSFRAGLHAASHALLNILPLYIMCNPSDLGSECANPHDTRYFPERLLLFDRHPGGIGIAAQARPLFAELLQAALELLVTCECSGGTGCPNCVQNFSCSEYNEVIDKQAAVIILKGVIQAEEIYREGLK